MKRILELDALRGLAALSVVLFHYTYQYFILTGYSEPIVSFFKFGGVGVQLFFVISGFVIFLTLDKSKSVFDFFVSRFSRLYPPYWFAVIFTSLVILITQVLGKEVDLKTFLLNMTMLQYFFGVDDIDGVYWTLRVEITFYFWIAFSFFLFGKKQIPLILFLWLFFSLLFSFHRNIVIKYDFCIGL